MKAPDHCQETKAVCKDLGNMVCVDNAICYWYCQHQCQEFIDFHKQKKKEKIRKLKQQRKERRAIMAARAELIQICEELGLDSEGLSIEELKDLIRKEVDKRFKKKKRVSADNMSEALLRFITLEFDFIIRDKNGNELDYKGNKVKDGVSKKAKKQEKT